MRISRLQWIIATMICFIGIAMFDSAALAAVARVSTESELTKALEDKNITHIYLRGNFVGNFTIPKWLEDFDGNGTSTISPRDTNKPTLYVDSGIIGDSDNLVIRNLSIKCEEAGGIAFDVTRNKPVSLVNINFLSNAKQNRSLGIIPLKDDLLKIISCSFNDITWCVYTNISSSEYNYNLVLSGCEFVRCGVAVAIDRCKPSSTVEFKNCKTYDKLYYAKNYRKEYTANAITVDRSTFDRSPVARYMHIRLEDQEYNRNYDRAPASEVIDRMLENRNAINKANYPYPDKLVVRAKDDTRLLIRMLKTEMNKNIKKIDFSDSDLSESDLKRSVNTLLGLQFATIDSILPYNRNNSNFTYSVADAVLRDIIPDNNIRSQVVSGFGWSTTKLHILTLSSPNVSWGAAGNTLDYFIKSSQPSKMSQWLRDKLQLFKYWSDGVRNNEKAIDSLFAQMERNMDDATYLNKVENAIRSLYNYRVAAEVFMRAMYFDLPMQIAFTGAYGRVEKIIKQENKAWFSSWVDRIKLSDAGKSRVTAVAREIAPFYSISKLTVLLSTNDIRQEFIRFVKTALKKDSLAEAEAYLKTDADLLRDANNLEEFFNNYQ